MTDTQKRHDEAMKVKDLGSIKVKVQHEHQGRRNGPTAVTTFQNTESVSEKALKGQNMSHSVRYGRNLTISDNSSPNDEQSHCRCSKQ